MESLGEFDIDYWIGQARETVEFTGCAGSLARIGMDALVGIGLDGALVRTIDGTWPDPSLAPVVISSLEGPSDDGFVRAVARAYEGGLDIDFAGLFAGEVRRRISAPIYPFQRRRHWI